jgi:hypothetical protein
VDRFPPFLAEPTAAGVGVGSQVFQAALVAVRPEASAEEDSAAARLEALAAGGSEGNQGNQVPDHSVPLEPAPADPETPAARSSSRLVAAAEADSSVVTET